VGAPDVHEHVVRKQSADESAEGDDAAPLEAVDDDHFVALG
jgi:hypothetical protein